MWDAIDLLDELPLCQRVIKAAHNSLLQGVRREGKQPGEYRTIPNWIGPPGSPIEEARFVPISADKLQGAMSEWESYIHGEAPDRLVQLAILHAEFEALHPFLDGNGRLGRMCVPLFMFNKSMINTPNFHISAFFEANRDEYYNRLLAVSRDDDWTGWCEFFLQAVAIQALENLDKTNKILDLYEAKKEQVVDLTRSQHAIQALDYLFSHSIFIASHFNGMETIPKPTAIRILAVLRENGIIIT